MSDPPNTVHSGLEDYEKEDGGRYPFLLSYREVKLLGITGVPLPSGLEGVLKASANIGSVVANSVSVRYAADYFGRKAVYGKELMVIIFATIMSISDPTGDLSPNGRRGTMLAYIFANQGWGSLVGSLAVIIVLACYHNAMEVHGETSKVDGVWRILIGLSLIPAFGTLYQRLTSPTQKGQAESIDELKKAADADPAVTSVVSSDSENATPPASAHVETAPATQKAHFADFVRYFSEWRHAKILLGTCSCWFFVDIAFYGINLNQNVSGSPWTRLFKIGVGNLIITALGFVPGYYATILTIEKLGRKWIQIQGFLLAALFLGILAGKFYTLGTVPFIVNFALLQVHISLLLCYPAEVFPTRYRASAHGRRDHSALVFNSLTNKIGTPNVLWIFFGCCLAGAVCTLLLPEVRGRDPDLILAQEEREASRVARCPTHAPCATARLSRTR
ncbi:MFS general substrate transporter [Amylocystis lapponica]|nr:MFS general substrate transporter [Amylocystis lapponica]